MGTRGCCPSGPRVLSVLLGPITRSPVSREFPWCVWLPSQKFPYYRTPLHRHIFCCCSGVEIGEEEGGFPLGFQRRVTCREWDMLLIVFVKTWNTFGIETTAWNVLGFILLPVLHLRCNWKLVSLLKKPETDIYPAVWIPQDMQANCVPSVHLQIENFVLIKSRGKGKWNKAHLWWYIIRKITYK